MSAVGLEHRRRGISAPGFPRLPTNNLVLRLCADLGVTKSGNKVTQLLDQSPSAMTFAEPTGAQQGTWNATSIQNRAGITMTSTAGDVFINPSVNMPSASATYTTFCVINQSGSVASFPWCCAWFGQGNGLAIGSDNKMRVVDNAGYHVTGLTVPAGPSILECTNTGGTVTPAVNGVTGTQFSFTPNPTGQGEACFGASFQGGSANNFTGDVCEWLMYTPALSSTDAARVRYYLAAYYGIPVV